VFDLTFPQVLSRLIAATLVLTVLGLSFAGAARLLGDRGVGYEGKLKPNPILHVDLFAIVTSVFGRVGWIKPLRIDTAESLGGRWAPALAALAAALVTLMLSKLTVLLLPLVASYWPASSAGFVDWTIREIPQIAAWTLAINIVPLPPLLGGYVLQGVSPEAHRWLVRRHFWITVAITALVVVFHKSLPLTPFNWLATLFMTGAL
jgi:hypothetical protein